VKGVLIMSDKTLDLIIGRKTGLKHSTLVYVCVWYTFIALVAFVAVDLAMLIFSDEILDTIAFIGLTIGLLILFLFMNKKANIFNAVNKKRKERIYEAKEKRFRMLSPEQQAEVVQITEYFQKVNRTGCNEHYVWGTFEKMRKSNALCGGEPKFEYIPYTDIIWVHMVNRSMPIISASMTGMSSWEISQKSICVYTYNGECYRFTAGLDFYRHLREAITNINPTCKFGYTKELQKEYVHLKRIRKEFK
jgi:hypothetical protein